MDHAKLLQVLSLLRFPGGQYAVFGGACLAAHHIRTTSDLEIFVTHELYRQLQTAGWDKHVTGSTGASYLTATVKKIPVLAFVMCGSDKWRPDVAAYLHAPEIIDGFPFMPLKEMYAWKAATARPKDLADVALIDRYWAATK